MDIHTYERLFQFKQGLGQAFSYLDLFEKLESESLDYVRKVRANLSELRGTFATSNYPSRLGFQQRKTLRQRTGREAEAHCEQASQDAKETHTEARETPQRPAGDSQTEAMPTQEEGNNQ
jgi:hypothetical protein